MRSIVQWVHLAITGPSLILGEHDPTDLSGDLSNGLDGVHILDGNAKRD